MTEASPERNTRSLAVLPPRCVDEGKPFSVVRELAYCCDSTTNFVDEVKSLPPPHARRLYSHRHKVNTGDDIAVLLSFLHLGCCSGRASLVAACRHVTQCECVWARSVPSQTPTSSPWKLRYTVGPFADTCTKTMWLPGR